MHGIDFSCSLNIFLSWPFIILLNYAITDLFILHIPGEKHGKHRKGLYHDDGLTSFEYSSWPKGARIGKDF